MTTTPIRLAILIIEDSVGDADLVEEYLRDIQTVECSVERATTLVAGGKALEASEPDLVLLDAGLPDATWRETIEGVTHRTDQTTPVIVLTGNPSPKLEETALRHGVAGFLRKDWLDRELFEQRLRGIVERHRDRRDLQRTRRALDQAREGVVIADARRGDMPLVYCNEGFSRMTGYERGEVLGRNCRFLQCAETSQQTVDRIRSALKMESYIRVQLLNARKDGERFWNELSLTPIRDHDGRLIQYVGVQRDVTRRVEAESQLELYRTAVEAAEEGVIVKDGDGRIHLVNRSLEAITGIDRDDMLGRLLDDVLEGHDVEAIHRADRFARQQGQAYTHEFELRFDEDPQTFETTRVPLESESVQDGTVAVIRDITERKQMEKELQKKALYDQLTGLPNLNLFEQHLAEAVERARTHREPFALMLLDLDDFHRINDSLGHAAGDTVLNRLALRLRNSLPDDYLLARLRGDEFLVLVPDASDRDALDGLVERLLEVFQIPFFVNELELHLALSLGIIYRTSDADSPEDLEAEVDFLVREADRTVQTVKSVPGNAWTIHTPTVQQRKNDQIELEADLRRALKDEAFTPVAQPIFDLQSGGVYALEILARWEHPERGPVSPAVFIPIAERAGLLDDLTELVLTRAYQQLDDAVIPDGISAPMRLYLNINGSQISRPGLAEALEAVRRDHAPKGLQLSLEITEGQMIERYEKVCSLRERGFRVIVDDFGTGYSSLSRLKDMPMDELKLDKEFVQGAPKNRGDAAVLRTIIELGRQMELPIIGEGVETADQLELLREAGCDAVQGFYLARPSPIDSCLNGLREAAARTLHDH